MQIDHCTTRMQTTAIIGRQDGSTTGSENNGMTAGQFVNNSSFALAKATLPFQLENGRDRNAGTLANQLVTINKIVL